jgi:hypothetical protein
MKAGCIRRLVAGQQSVVLAFVGDFSPHIAAAHPLSPPDYPPDCPFHDRFLP